MRGASFTIKCAGIESGRCDEIGGLCLAVNSLESIDLNIVAYLRRLFGIIRHNEIRPSAPL
jgi:hypothetical protein